MNIELFIVINNVSIYKTYEIKKKKVQVTHFFLLKKKKKKSLQPQINLEAFLC